MKWYSCFKPFSLFLLLHDLHFKKNSRKLETLSAPGLRPTVPMILTNAFCTFKQRNHKRSTYTGKTTKRVLLLHWPSFGKPRVVSTRGRNRLPLRVGRMTCCCTYCYWAGDRADYAPYVIYYTAQTGRNNYDRGRGLLGVAVPTAGHAHSRCTLSVFGLFYALSKSFACVAGVMRRAAL